MLPNFLIIGAAKSATTWLMHALDRHPHVYVHDTEIHYFSSHYSRRLPLYEAHFTEVRNERAVGENSNSYLPSRVTPRRIHQHLPEAKLIAVLRDPTERAYSGYCMNYEHGRVSGDIARHLDPDEVAFGQRPDMLSPGLYAEHLRRYLQFFPESQIKVVLYDDLKADRRAFLDEILGFLGIDPTLLPEVDERRVNVRRTRTYPPGWKALTSAIETIPAGKALLKKLAVRPLSKKIKEGLATTRRVSYPPLSAELRAKLVDYYSRDIIDLEAMIGRDLRGWRSQP